MIRWIISWFDYWFPAPPKYRKQTFCSVLTDVNYIPPVQQGINND